MLDISPASIFNVTFSCILCYAGVLFFLARLRYLSDGLSRPIPHWQIAMVIMLFILAMLQLADSVIMYASGHNSRLGQEVMADNLIRIIRIYNPLGVPELRYLCHLFYLACDLLQTLVFTIAILQSARYSWRDQRMFYWVSRVEYTSLGILATSDLFYYIFFWPYLEPYFARLLPFKAIKAILVLTVSIRMIHVVLRMIHVVLTIILLAASIRLKMQSNPARDISKVRTISYERYISANCESILRENIL